MAGFTFNGIGASDSYYMLKELPGHQCRHCGQSDMAVMELRMKVRIVYIPTLTLYKKYGVICPKCKEGFYISEEQKDYLLQHDPSCLEITNEGVRILQEQEDDAALPTADDACDIASETPEVAAEEIEQPVVEQQEAQTCPQCHAAIIPGALFCMKCGCKLEQAPTAEVTDEPADGVSEIISQLEEIVTIKEADTTETTEAELVEDQEEASPAPAIPINHNPASFTYVKGKVCPECGMHATGDKTVCSICGTKLE